MVAVLKTVSSVPKTSLIDVYLLKSLSGLGIGLAIATGDF